MREMADLSRGGARPGARRADRHCGRRAGSAVVTAVLGLPGIVSDRTDRRDHSAVAGFLGMAATEWGKPAGRLKPSEELDLVLGVIDDRIETLNEEVLRRLAQRNQPRPMSWTLQVQGGSGDADQAVEESVGIFCAPW